MLVEVTQEDIERGQPRNAFSCAVALAIVRAQRGDDDFVNCVVDVREGEATVWTSKQFSLHRVPTEARVWIDRFDAQQPVEPFTFELPDSVCALVAP